MNEFRFDPQYIRWAIRRRCLRGNWKAEATVSSAALAWERITVMDTGNRISFRRTLRKCKRGAVSMTNPPSWLKPEHWME